MSKKGKNKETVVEERDLDKETSSTEHTEKDINPVEALELELDKEKDHYLRLFAEFENYKKRTIRERIELFRTAGEEVITSLLPVLDDFDRAISEMEKTADDNLLKGVSLISDKFRSILNGKGLSQIKTKQGDVFNADDHEAITQIPAPSKKLKGKIIDVIEQGYTLGDKVIRFPKVVIGQ